ncbi:MAG: FAD-binding protein [Oscillospiraceae bacterium]|nr:FAD-binding protein [Oscillospiraceae bacterium]
MRETTVTIGGRSVRLYTLNTAVIGTGAAGFNAADRLWQYGQKDIAIITEHINAGTSRNTGSDKQTYYKLSLSGDDPDSVRALAGVLFAGQCVDGDIALCEAALSAQSFLRLCELGVPFPKNRYGEYIGYKTDHDPNRRATSVGPYTSKRMTECLERSVAEKGIRIFDKLQVVRIVSKDDRLAGVLCVDLDAADDAHRFVAFNCTNLIFATGGPAGMYADSVYPLGHYGATGVAFEAGVRGKNLTEWQYGLASVRPRWNVSGTYMQVLPRFVSTDKDGKDEREFLFDFFADKGEMLSKVFLKGYQWPFDVRKVDGGSSIIDILVYIESCIKGRRVFLDFRSNPRGEPIDFSALAPEARDYLEKAGACFGTPVERLLHMNAPAVSFYMDKGVDLQKEPLEIALCAQHNNGGVAIDCWWQTNIEGFFAAGEVSASHGVYRPGGSALNAGQVGSTRAAQYIAARRTAEPADEGAFLRACAAPMGECMALADRTAGGGSNVKELFDAAAARMSRVGAAIRDGEGIRKALGEIKQELDTFASLVRTEKPADVARMYRLHDTLVCQYVYLSAMVDYAENGGASRGSALYSDKNGKLPYTSLPEIFRFTLDDGSRGGRVQEAAYKDGACSFSWRDVRPMPQDDDFFENVWRSYRENGNID